MDPLSVKITDPEIMYPNIVKNLNTLCPNNKDSVINLFKEVANEINDTTQRSAVPTRYLQSKWLIGCFQTIETLFKNGVSEEKKLRWLESISQRGCQPALISISESFIASAASVSEVKKDEVVPYLIREFKRSIIQEIITSNILISGSDNFHTIHAMNLLIKEKWEELGISKDDPLYIQADLDIYTEGPKRDISEALNNKIDPFFKALTNKFCDYYTKEGIIKFAYEWINDYTRKDLRSDLLGLIQHKILPKPELWDRNDYNNDVSDFIQKKCLKNDLTLYEFTDYGVFILFEDEINKIEDLLGNVEKKVLKDGLSLKDLNEKWKSHLKIIRTAISQNQKALQYAHPDAIAIIIEKNNSLIKYAPLEIILSRIKEKPSLIQHVSIDVALPLIQNDPPLLKHVLIDVVKVAVEKNPSLLKFASKEIALNMINENPSLLPYGNHNITLPLIKNTPSLILHFDIERDMEFIIEALSQNIELLQLLPKDLLLNKEFILKATIQAPNLYYHVPDQIRTDKAFMLSLINALAFGQKHWELYFGKISDAPKLPENIIDIMSSPDPYDTNNPPKTVAETHLLVLVPTTVNGKKLNLNSLPEIVQNPLKGHQSCYRYTWGSIISEHGEKTPEKAYWTLLSKDVIPGSNNETYKKQQELVKAKQNYEVPDLLSIVVGIFTHHVRTGTFLFSKNPWTYTRCKETATSYQTSVGGFGPDGLYLYVYETPEKDVGIAVQRRLSDP